MHTEPTNTFGARVLDTIEARAVHPKPSWHFLVREGMVWVVAGCTFLVGSIATALTIYIGDASYLVEHHIASRDSMTLFEKLPFIWIVLLVVGVGYTVHALHTTRRGYRWPTTSLVGIAVLLSTVAGWSMHRTGFSEVLDRYLLSTLPIYQPVSGFYPEHWMAYDRGVVVGVVEVTHHEGFSLRGLHGGVVEVRLTHTTDVPRSVWIEEGVRLRVVGTTTIPGGVVFEASAVRPYHGRGGRRVGSMHYEGMSPRTEGRVETQFEVVKETE